MIPFRKSLGFRLLAATFILLTLPLFVDVFILAGKQYKHIAREAEEHLSEVAAFRELPLSQIQPLNKPLLEVIAYLLRLDENTTGEELNQKLKELAKTGEFSDAFVLKITADNQYIVTGSSQPQFLGENWSDFLKTIDLFSPEVRTQGYANYLFYDEKTTEPHIIVAHVIYSADGKPTAILAISDNIQESLKELLPPDLTEYPVKFALLLLSHRVFAATDSERISQYVPPLTAESVFFEFTWPGEVQIGYIKRLEGSNFSLLTYASKADIFRQPLLFFFHSNILYAITLLIGAVIAYLLTMRMAKPIQNLALVMARIQKGSLDLRYQKDLLGFEINSLGEIFNKMVEAIIEKKHLAEEERVKREKLAHELRLGQQMQRSLLPQKMPRYQGVELAETYIPAIEVGG